MFVDLVGFTSLSESRDPEDVRDLLSRYFQVAREAVAKYGGTIEKFIGDAVMAVWGTPVAREDDATRAVRSALDLVEGVTAFGREIGFPELRGRGGVATGRAASWARSSEGLVVGDRVNTASRVQSVAPPGGVFVDQLTREGSAGAIEYRDGGVHEVKGKSQPLQLWHAVRAVEGGRRRPAGGPGQPTTRGRDGELRLLKELFQSAVDRRAPGLVTVTGPPGIGKSRLVEEFVQYLNALELRVLWHEAECSPPGDGVAFGALAQIFRQRLGVSTGDGPEEVAQKLEESLHRLLPDPEDREFVQPKMAVLLGLPGPAETPTRDEFFAGWRLFFEGLAKTGPVVLTLEHLQWADEGLLDFLERLLEWCAGLPLFVFALARPELLSRRPSWSSGRRSQVVVHLDPLTDDDLSSLIEEMVPGFTPELRLQLVRRCDGIPLFAIETVRMLSDRGLIVERDGRRQVSDELHELDTPVSLEALIAARLDELDLAERELVKNLAVLGLRFSRAAVDALSTDGAASVDQMLQSLLRKEVLVAQTGRRTATDTNYAFAQTLLRTVAYDRLGKRERRARHLAVAGHLRQGSPTEQEEASEMIASHYHDAYRADPRAEDAEEIRSEASTWLVRAAGRAAEVGAPERAQEIWLRAAEISQDEVEALSLREQAARMAFLAGRADEALKLFQEVAEAHQKAGREQDAARLTGRMGSALGRLGRAEDAILQLRAALEVMGRTAPETEVASVVSQLGRELSIAGRPAEALPEVERALAVAEAFDLTDVLCDALETKGLILRSQGRPQEALLLFDGTVQISSRRGYTSEELLSGHANSADTRMANDLPDAVGHLEAALAIARRLGQRYSEAFLAGNLMLALLFTGEWERMEGIADQLLKEEISRLEIVYSRMLVLHSLRGEVDSANEDLTRLERWRSHDSAEPRTLHTALRGAAALAAGDAEAGLAACTEALRTAVPAFGLRHEIARQAWPDACEAAIAVGRPEVALGLVHEIAATPTGMVPPYLRLQATRVSALAGGVDEPSSPLAAAAAGFAALGHRYWWARTLAEQAAVAEAPPADLAEALALLEELRAPVPTGRRAARAPAAEDRRAEAQI